MFTDEIEIQVRAGDGGNGCLSFRREKYVPKGGPDGGDGGAGGSVVLVVEPGETSLHGLKGFAEFAAGKGGPGGPKNCTGRDGEDLCLRVPQGTQVLDAERGNLLADLDAIDSRVVVARGGKGGRGNTAFASATNRAPRQVEPGRPGERRRLRLVLKLIADVGLVGLPNAGKSTLLSVLSAARPRIAAYPFTTLRPCLGIVERAGAPPFVMADIPGLIEGASEGRGLGHRFLRHVERTRLLLHLVDCSELADQDPVEAFHVVREELASYSRTLAERPWLLAGTKVEGEAARARCAELQAAVGAEVWPISAATHGGLDPLLGALVARLAALRA